MPEASPYEKIQAQSDWYGRRARKYQRGYYCIKGIEIIAAAAIPLAALPGASETQRWLSAGLGALISVLEGFLQMGQFQRNWLLFRATREALRREDFLYSAKAGAYAAAQEPERLFFERCDAILSGESARWASSREQSASQAAQ